MNRTVLLLGAVAVALIVLSVVLFVLYTQTGDDLDQGNATATAAFVNAVATQEALSAAQATQGAAFDTQSTQQSQVIRTATRSAANSATESAQDQATATRAYVNAVVTEEALKADQATQGAAFDTQSTQQSQVIRTATRSAANSATESAQDRAAATEAHVAANATQDALHSELDSVNRDLDKLDIAYFNIVTQQVQVARTATQSAADFATQSARDHATATEAYAAAAVTQDALSADLATQETRDDERYATIQAQADHIQTLEAPVTAGDEPVADIDVGDLLMREDFDTDQLWYVGPVRNAGRVDLRGGQYWITIVEPEAPIEVWGLPFIMDAYVEAEVYFNECPSDGYFAVSARVDSSGDETYGYYFGVSCSLKLWDISAYSAQGNNVLDYNAFTPLAENPARRHVLGLWLKGSALKFYFDGVELGSVTDDTFKAGLVGFYAWAGEEKMIVKIESLRAWWLP